MTLVQIMSADDGRVLLRTSDPAGIAAELAGLGIRYERWTATGAADGADQVLAAYQDDVDRLRSEGGYVLVDVFRLVPDDTDPAWREHARAQRDFFFREHVHSHDEVRVVETGRGCFYLRLRDQVVAVVCEPGDLLSVPAGVRHWFDAGSDPELRMIRFMHDDRWVGEFTGDPAPDRFPALHDVLVDDA